MILLRQKSFAYGIRTTEIQDYAKTNNIGVKDAQKALYEQAEKAGKSKYGTYAGGDKSTYKGSQLHAVQGSTGVQGETSGGLFTVKNTNKKSAGYAAEQAQQAHLNNANRVWADKNKAANLRKQQQAFDKGQKTGFKQGQGSVGIWQGAQNTWKGMNNTQKGLAIGGAAAATIGTGMLIARNRKKRKDAERELELERARNRG